MEIDKNLLKILSKDKSIMENFEECRKQSSIVEDSVDSHQSNVEMMIPIRNAMKLKKK